MSVVDLTLLSLDGEPPERLAVEFSDDELEVLRQFADEYRRLSASKPVKDGLHCSLTFRANRETGVVWIPTVPSDDDLAILLHRMRPFLLHEEPASFNRTSAILGRRMTHPAIRKLLGDLHRFWDGRSMQSRIPIVLNYDLINTERVLLDWINSHEYHRDVSKAEAMVALAKQIPPELLQWAVTYLALDKVSAVQNLALVVGVITGDLQQLDFESHSLRRGA